MKYSIAITPIICPFLYSVFLALIRITIIENIRIIVKVAIVAFPTFEYGSLLTTEDITDSIIAPGKTEKIGTIKVKVKRRLPTVNIPPIIVPLYC